MIIKRGDIFFADLSPVVGSEQGGLRPVLVIQNDVGNKYSPTIIVAAITSQVKTKLPTHVEIGMLGNGLTRNSVILMEQLRTIDKTRLKEKIGHIDEPAIERVQNALSVSLGMGG
ncbi:MAG: type II toxin-antitoxin system PemK/MazF family toxin [Firmicutes bacterium]|nr:type II toxin-antitoxin system PemK/MazF family toxin [Clostridiales bacterium]MBQ4340735.1 type II toxin-antitoxin system PemK/MazF family toxin [Bacillota bacterium]MBR6700146.1 type II toxin-antitoxin system PemK/MazF family toxin [Bacillota bacterium]